MPFIETALVSYLQADASLTALVGARVTPVKITATPCRGANAFPSVTLQTLSRGRAWTQDLGPTKLVNSRIEISAWGLSYSDAKNVADAVRKATGSGGGGGSGFNQLDGYRGTMAGLAIQGAFLEDENDELVPPVMDDDAPIFRVAMQFSIWHEET